MIGQIAETLKQVKEAFSAGFSTPDSPHATSATEEEQVLSRPKEKDVRPSPRQEKDVTPSRRLSGHMIDKKGTEESIDVLEERARQEKLHNVPSELIEKAKELAEEAANATSRKGEKGVESIDVLEERARQEKAIENVPSEHFEKAKELAEEAAALKKDVAKVDTKFGEESKKDVAKADTKFGEESKKTVAKVDTKCGEESIDVLEERARQEKTAEHVPSERTEKAKELAEEAAKATFKKDVERLDKQAQLEETEDRLRLEAENGLEHAEKAKKLADEAVKAAFKKDVEKAAKEEVMVKAAFQKDVQEAAKDTPQSNDTDRLKEGPA